MLPVEMSQNGPGVSAFVMPQGGSSRKETV